MLNLNRIVVKFPHLVTESLSAYTKAEPNGIACQLSALADVEIINNANNDRAIDAFVNLHMIPIS